MISSMSYARQYFFDMFQSNLEPNVRPFVEKESPTPHSRPVSSDTTSADSNAYTAGLAKFEKLSLSARKMHLKEETSLKRRCNLNAADGESVRASVRHRHNSETDINEPPQQNHGFYAEMPANPTSESGLLSWFRGEWEVKHVGRSARLHSHVDSLFSSSSGFNNFRGLLNLGIILLVVSNLRVALENLIKYGVLIDPVAIAVSFLEHRDQLVPCAWILLSCNIFVLFAFLLEILLEKEKLPYQLLVIPQLLNLLAILTIPAFIVLKLHPNPFFSAPTLGVCSVLFLKLWSYRDVNSWCRYERIISQSKHFERKRNKSIASALNELDKKHTGKNSVTVVKYPDNITLSNLYYFVFAPTLCYELNFPRLLKIRKRFLLKRLLELVFLPQVMAALAQQWIIPILNNSVKPFRHSEWPVVVERLMKLAIPNHLIWLIFFYVFFHSALNVFGELLLFGDRSFYKDWWNSEQVTVFWSTWNIPVHRFAKRHIFSPLTMRWKLSKLQASCIVFLVSAFFHEYLVSVPLKMFRLWAFSAMISQVPFAIFVSKVLKGGQLGNLAVWFSLIIGQPLAMIMYFHDYYLQMQESQL